jgi:hypothetical protein
MFKKIRIGLACIALASLAGCTGMLSGLMGGAPPAAVSNAARIARGPIDFALHSFDAALYAFDLAMDLHRPAAGTPEARRIAALGRRVLAALTLADEAQKAGSASSYDEAFARANAAFNEFRTALNVPATDAAALDLRAARPQLAAGLTFTSRDREAILAQAEGRGGGTPALSR